MKHASRPKVLLVNPPCPFLAFPNAAPHLGLGYLASYLREHGVEVDYANHESSDPAEVVLPEGYDVYAFTAVTPQYPFARQLLSQVRRRALGLAALGGAHASVLPEDGLRDGFDFVVTGYGESALLAIARGTQAPGLVAGRALPNTEDAPFPAWDLLYQTDYDVSYGQRTGHVFGSRGCPYECHYCCSPTMYGTKVGLRPIERVIAEIEALRELRGVETIYFFDPTFTLQRPRTLRLLAALAPLNLDWTCQTRVDHIDAELLCAMRAAGCGQISFGIETGVAEVHANLNKEAPVELNSFAIRAARDAGLRVKTFLMGALPDDDAHANERFQAFLLENPPDRWLYSTFTPFPGTDYWRRPEHYGIEIVRRDLRTYYPLGLNARGPVNVRTRHFDQAELEARRDEMLAFLRREFPDPRVEEAIRRFPRQRQLFERCLADLEDRDFMFGSPAA